MKGRHAAEYTMQLFLYWLCLCVPTMVVGFTVSQQHHRHPQQFLKTQTLLKALNAKPSGSSSSSAITPATVIVGEEIGSGSYGTVHFVTVNDQVRIGKRAWTQEEFLRSNNNNNNNKNVQDPKERATRALYYWQVEKHCFAKMESHPQIPPYYGTTDDKKWMIFGLVGDTNTNEPAPTLGDLMKLDRSDPQSLTNIGKALGCTTYEETLDKTLESLLEVLKHVHEQKIVHRDVKPSNLLVHDGKLLLMDFGSAADLEKSSSPGSLLKKRVGLEDGNRVAISPIYCAPEIFISLNNHPTSFDIFSSGLLFCQLLFSFLDERMDAGFHQQLAETDWDLNSWLAIDLGSTVRPKGLTHALEYLAERQGLWTLLCDLLSKQPERRPTAAQAKKQLQLILQGKGSEDSPYFNMVIEALETCEIPTVSRPLHFVATFARNKPLGLVLSERTNEEEEDDDEEFQTVPTRQKWLDATKDAAPGEVFVRGIIPNSQADELGIFEIGDRLEGIGEFPFVGGGFEKAVAMLQDQPKKTKNVKLHFDRLRTRDSNAVPMTPLATTENPVEIADQGAWSVKGRRPAQEDAYILHEFHVTKDRSVLLTGVMDGHGGKAASQMVAKKLPEILNQLLIFQPKISLQDALTEAWDVVCQTYRNGCSGDGEDTCVAPYDATSGILDANTGSDTMVAGTTCTAMALEEQTGTLIVLNCGDSRSLVVNNHANNNKESKKNKKKNDLILFATTDHKPELEQERFIKGREELGLDYAMPKCRMSRWWIPVGDYDYAVSRSLEGPLPTSKGIISDADVSVIQLPTLQQQQNNDDNNNDNNDNYCSLISASDGLWEVMDSEEVANDIIVMRQQGKSAGDVAKVLCSMALEKGTLDNVSVTIVYLK